MTPSPWRQERQIIKCCHGCVAPRRYPGCGANCKEYKDEKAQYLADKQKEKEYLANHPKVTNYDFNTNHR